MEKMMEMNPFPALTPVIGLKLLVMIQEWVDRAMEQVPELVPGRERAPVPAEEMMSALF